MVQTAVELPVQSFRLPRSGLAQAARRASLTCGNSSRRSSSTQKRARGPKGGPA